MAINFKDWQKNLHESVELDEALKGDQHKLDVDKDGEIEKSDLKKLRSKKDDIVVNKGEQVKEGEGCGKKMYREFVEEIEEIVEAKKDDYWDFKDLKDEPKSTTRKVAGTRYGGSAQHDEPEDDDDDAPKKKVDQPKRGRGRPKGSASGARQQGNGQKKSYGGLAIHSLSLPNRNK